MALKKIGSQSFRGPATWLVIWNAELRILLNSSCWRRSNSISSASATGLMTPTDRVNAEIVVRLQEVGTVAPSTTTIGGRLAIRAAIVNHRTDEADIDKAGRLHIGSGTQPHPWPQPLLPQAQRVPRRLRPRSMGRRSYARSRMHLESDPNSIDFRFRRGCS